MALTPGTAVKSIGVPTSPFRSYENTFTFGSSDYPDGGYDLSSEIKGTVVMSQQVFHYDGSTLRVFEIVSVSGTPTLKAFTTANGAKSTEESASADLDGHDGVKVACLWQ